MVKPQDHTDVTPGNIVRLTALEQLSAEDQEKAKEYFAKLNEMAIQRYLGQFSINRQNRVVKAGDLDITTILPTTSKVSPSPPVLSMGSVEKVMDEKLDAFNDRFITRIATMVGKSANPVFLSFDTAAATASPSTTSAESREPRPNLSLGCR